MTAGHKTDPLQRTTPKENIVLSLSVSAAIVVLSMLLGVTLIKSYIAVEYAWLTRYTVLLWAVLDFIIIIFLEPHRRNIGVLTIPAFIGMISIILMFVITESISRFFKEVSYGYLTPFVIIACLLIYAAVFREKNTVLKIYLGLSGIILAMLWAIAAADKITMPF